MHWRLKAYQALPALLVSALLVAAGSGGAWAKDPLAASSGRPTAGLLPQGGVAVLSGGKVLALLSLSVHGPDWEHAPQALAEATVRPAMRGDGEVAEGTLAVPKTDGGAVKFYEVVTPRDKGFSADYTFRVTQALTLNGLQVSLLLPTDFFAGKKIVIDGHSSDAKATAKGPVTLTVPQRLDGNNTQLFSGPATKIEIAPGTEDALTLVPAIPAAKEGQAAEAPNFLVQDLREWDQDMIEVRLSLVYADDGKKMAPAGKLHAGLEVTVARGLKWQKRAE